MSKVGKNIDKKVTTDNIIIDGENSTIENTSGDLTINPGSGQKVVIQEQVDVDNLNLNGNTISSTDVDGDINLTPNGAGEVNAGGAVNVDNLKLDGNTLSSTDVDGDINLTPNGAGELVVGGAVNVDNLKLDGNTISSTDTNGNIEIDPNGSGNTNIYSPVTINGDLSFTNLSPDINAPNGLTINTSTNNLTLTANQVKIDHLTFDSNQISISNPNSNLQLASNGSGDVVLTNGDLIVNSGQITLGSNGGNAISASLSDITIDASTNDIVMESTVLQAEQATPTTGPTVPAGYGSFYPGDDGKAYFKNDAGEVTELGSAAASGRIAFEVNQTSHGFVSLDAIYHNGSSWVKAQANADTTLAQYLVIEVIDANNFVASSSGVVEIIGHGKTVGEYYFLSDTTAGGSTSVTPTDGYNQPLFYVESSSVLHLMIERGVSTDILAPSGASSGSSGINYIDESDAESAITNWVEYQDSAASSPVDGIGGSPTVTITQNETNPLRGNADFLITKDAANRQGEGVSIPFTIDEADKAKVLRISFDYKGSANLAYNAGTAASPSDVVVYVYDVTNSTLIQPTQFCLDGSGKFISEFQSASDSTSYRLILHIATGNTAAWTLQVDNVQVGPREIARGPMVTDEADYVPTISSDSGSVTNYSIVYAKWSRIGDKIKIRFRINFSAASATFSGLRVGLPSGVTLASDSGTSGTGQRTGWASFPNGVGFIRFLPGDNYVKILSLYTDTTSAEADDELQNNEVTQADTATSSFFIAETGLLAVQGWSSNQVASSDFGGRVVAFEAQGSTSTQSIPDVTSTKVTNWTLVKDSTASYSSGTWTAPETGWYHVDASIRFAAPSSPVQFQIQLYKNGSNYKISKDYNTDAPNPTLSHTTYLNAGDYLEIYAYQDSAGALNLDGTTNANRFSVFKIQSPQTLMGGEVVAVRAIKNVDQNSLNNTDVVISYGSKQIDTHNAWNTSTNTFTAPVSGIYNIYTALRFTGTFAVSTFIRVRIRKNTVIQQEEYHICNGETDRTQSAGTILQLNAGETVDITGGSNDASFNIVNGGSIYTTINIHKVN